LELPAGGGGGGVRLVLITYCRFWFRHTSNGAGPPKTGGRHGRRLAVILDGDGMADDGLLRDGHKDEEDEEAEAAH